MRSTKSFGAVWPGLASGSSGVFLVSSGLLKPPLTFIMRATVSQDMLTALRIMIVAAIT